MSAQQQIDRIARRMKFRNDYFSTLPSKIDQLSADAMIVIIDLEAEIRELSKCSGNRGGPRCVDPKCWNDEDGYGHGV